ncbi:phage tail protein I, partial [Stutzerimonas stutzeri]|uniref:phage tail protein I n=1 Tax=Stutzerimonas stutzeri TaxID=316 RepID=UPI002447E7F9
PVRDVWNADTIPARYLPWLAWAYSVDEWDAAWQESQKRATVRQALAIQRQKGTIGAVRDALGALGIYVEVREWFQLTPPGEPYTFELYVEASQTPVTLEGIRAVEGVVNATKNLRSHLSQIRLSARCESHVHIGAVLCVGHSLTLNNYLTAADRELMTTAAQFDRIVNTDLPAALGTAA